MRRKATILRESKSSFSFTYQKIISTKTNKNGFTAKNLAKNGNARILHIHIFTILGRARFEYFPDKKFSSFGNQKLWFRSGRYQSYHPSFLAFQIIVQKIFLV